MFSNKWRASDAAQVFGFIRAAASGAEEIVKCRAERRSCQKLIYQYRTERIKPRKSTGKNLSWSFISPTRKFQVQVIKMLAVVVLIFAVCWLPYRAMVMYNSFATVHFRPLW
jgi:hypothetical protein